MIIKGNILSNYLRIIFAGTPDFAACHLEALLNNNYQVVGIFTKPDRPKGRGNLSTPSPVKQLAIRYGLSLFQPVSMYEHWVLKKISELNADIMVVVAYGLILPKSLLNIPKLGCINVHGSLLPRWRGAAPIQRALLAGDKHTGITIMQMNAELDTGAILHKAMCIIDPNDTTASLYNKLMQIGPSALLNVLVNISEGKVKTEIQDNTLATYAYKIKKKEARIDWSLPATLLDRYIRAFNPWPISYFILSEQIIKVWLANVDNEQNTLHFPGTILVSNNNGIKVATGRGILTLMQLQLAGKKVISVKNFLNSHREWFIPGTILN